MSNLVMWLWIMIWFRFSLLSFCSLVQFQRWLQHTGLFTQAEVLYLKNPAGLGDQNLSMVNTTPKCHIKQPNTVPTTDTVAASQCPDAVKEVTFSLDQTLLHHTEGAWRSRLISPSVLETTRRATARKQMDSYRNERIQKRFTNSPAETVLSSSCRLNPFGGF